MAELAGVDRDTISAWSRRSSQLREWAARNLKVVEGGSLSAAQLAARAESHPPGQPEELAWTQLLMQWRADARGLLLDRASFRRGARGAAHIGAHALRPGARGGRGREGGEVGVHSRLTWLRSSARNYPVDTERTPRELVEVAVDEVSLRLTAPRAAHQRGGP